MKKILSIAVLLVVAVVLVGCGDPNSADPIINDEVETSQVETVSKETDEGVSSEEIVYNNRVYYVGDDITEGKYVINCTKSKYGMDAIVFKTESDYREFQNAERYTTGEFKKAVEKFAWASFYIKETESAYISLESGNVILLDDGLCEFSKYDALNSNTLYTGIYVVGKDISSGGIDIKCTTDYLKIVVFENLGKYSEYHKADRYTIGQESDAIERYCLNKEFIYKKGSASVNLKDGMILMIDEGVGQFTADSGPIVN